MTDQISIIDIETKKRNFNYKESNSKDGSFSSHIRPEVGERLANFCRLSKKNRTKYVEECIIRCLEIDEKDFLTKLSKEELIEIVMKNGGKKHNG